MNIADDFADALLSNISMLKGTIGDFTEAEMLVRPCPGANHAAWQLGHLIKSERGMVNAAKEAVVPELPAGFADRFEKKAAGGDDPHAFASREELLNLFTKNRTAAADWIRTLTATDFAKKMPEEIARFAPTVGRLAIALPVHFAMHLGQFQVIRRKLGRPLLF